MVLDIDLLASIINPSDMIDQVSSDGSHGHKTLVNLEDGSNEEPIFVVPAREVLFGIGIHDIQSCCPLDRPRKKCASTFVLISKIRQASKCIPGNLSWNIHRLVKNLKKDLESPKAAVVISTVANIDLRSDCSSFHAFAFAFF